MPAKPHKKKQNRGGGEPSERRPGGGKHRKDLGAMARAVTWYFSLLPAMRWKLLADYPDGPHPRELPDGPTDRQLLAALDWYLSDQDKEDLNDTLNDKLDASLDKMTGMENRTFQMIRYEARDPGLLLRKKDGEHLPRLVDIVGACPGFEYTVPIYDSLYWELITRTRPSEARISEIIDHQLAKLSLYRATEEEAATSKECAIDTAPFKPVLTETYKTGIMNLMRGATIDHLALLGALLREAMFNHSIARTTLISDAFSMCLTLTASNIELEREALLLLEWLSHYRIIKDRWGSIPDKDSLALARAEINAQRRERHVRPLSQKKDSWRVQALALRFHNRSAGYRYPIVQLSEEIKSIKDRSKNRRPRGS